jgi:hypothetical protein
MMAVTPPPAPAPPQQLSVPVEQPPTGSIPISMPATEKHVDIDTHGREIDVREALQFLADEGGLKLVFSPAINKKIRLKLLDVSVPQALETVLSLAGLTLESTTSVEASRSNTSVVFYALPVNVDSLSVDAIMKRFSVGRNIAELIVSSRTIAP